MQKGPGMTGPFPNFRTSQAYWKVLDAVKVAL
jgi:hypothetical protein